MKKMLFMGVALLLVIPAIAGAIDWVDFTVARHADTTTPTTAGFDSAMTEVSTNFKYDNHNCTVDVPCTARFRRSGAIGVFGTSGDGLDVITTQAELNSVFGVTTHRAKVVDAVDYCAGSYNTSIVGCGRCDAFGYIVEEWSQGNVYVHEYGHNVLGCGHRDDCDFNVMNTYTNGQNNAVNAGECSGFGGRAYTTLCGEIYDGHGGPLTVSGGPYWLNCNVTVPAGRTLTIQAGVEIQFHQGLHITSTGTTNADGSATQIIIYSNNKDRDYPTAYVDGDMIISNGGQLILD